MNEEVPWSRDDSWIAPRKTSGDAARKQKFRIFTEGASFGDTLFVVLAFPSFSGEEDPSPLFRVIETPENTK
ncbi:unnamed protein product [Timema podura]|uniref:Uncharacterized protein n=1 Tax=Timema podura TaxID=61482 RepID=A0ABN7P234_TIMPD|nr:unnamed protein product [Timema podura]